MSDGITARCTDLRNAERLVELFGEDLRYVGAWSRWLVWDGRRWRIDEDGGVMRCTATTARRMVEEALAELTIANQLYAAAPKSEAAEAAKKDAERVLAWCVGSQNERRLAAMVALARTFSAVAIVHDKLDADPELLNVENGTLDLRTGELRSHRRADLMTKLAPVAFDANAKCDVWAAFLARAMGGDDELVRYLQRMLGYSLTGLTREHALGFFFGGGANGKSTCLSTIHAMLVVVAAGGLGGTAGFNGAKPGVNVLSAGGFGTSGSVKPLPVLTDAYAVGSGPGGGGFGISAGAYPSGQGSKSVQGFIGGSSGAHGATVPGHLGGGAGGGGGGGPGGIGPNGGDGGAAVTMGVGAVGANGVDGQANRGAGGGGAGGGGGGPFPGGGGTGGKGSSGRLLVLST